MRAILLPLLLIGCAEDESANEPPAIEMSSPEEGTSIALDPEGEGVDVLVVVHDEDPDALVVAWETDREGMLPDYAIASGVGKDDVGYELHLPADTQGEQTLTFWVEDSEGEQATREWEIALVE